VTLRSVIAEAERAGARSAVAFALDPKSACHLPIGSFNSAGSPRANRLLLTLMAIRLPARWLLTLRFGGHTERMRRFVTRYAYWRGVRRNITNRDTWRRLTQTPVILMYHAIGAPGERPSTYVVGRWRFRCQMSWLYWRGYRAVTVSDLTDALAAGRLLPPRTVVITFDDGYEDVYREAIPVLSRYGFTGTIFVVSGAVGGAAVWGSEPALTGRPLATRPQLQAMAAAGIEIGAHTASHPALTALPYPARRNEIQRSRGDLERIVNRPVTSFAYPFGSYDYETTVAVRTAGFAAACCSRSGRIDPATPPFELRRAEVRGTDSFTRFVRMLGSGRRTAA
jgi:peptidoglycan/xylan/chitin deacetylase (PgdA/CDA1 family)